MPRTPLTYPPARRGDTLEVLHGTPVADPYRWMEDLDADETQQWVAAENELTHGYLAKLPAREEIRQRLTALWDYEKYGVPFRRGSRVFYTYNPGLLNQGVLYWQASLDAEPQPLLDPNALSEDGTVALTGYEVSDNGRWLAYGVSASGSDWQEWRVREVETGRDLPDLLRWVKFSGAAWRPDGAGFYYCRYDRPAEGNEYKGAVYGQKLYYHRLGAPQEEDVLAYERPDQREWIFQGEVTQDGRYLVVGVFRGTDRENGVFYRDLQGDGQMVELLREFDAEYDFIGSEGPLFYFRTDAGAPMYRLIAIDIRAPERTHWREIVAETGDTIERARMAGGLLVLSRLHDAHSELAVYDAAGRKVRDIPLPGIGSVAGLQARRQDPLLFYAFAGFTAPGTIYRYDVTTGEGAIFRQSKLGFDPDAYETRLAFCASKDGARVPLFITHKRGLALTGDAPTYLYGYGGFGISMTPGFSVANLVWMERGGIYAQACLRGGGEYGTPWHDGGKKLAKQNVFHDFIAAGEWLIANGYTRPARLAIGGGSNGGLLVGACLTQRPDLFGACFAAVGVLDMLRFHLFTIGWAWTSDYGSPDEPADFAALLAYSPYHNVRAGAAYPATLITTADHDDRVYPAHSFKFAAALQAAQGGPAPILIRIETKAGHGAGKPTAKLIAEAADRLAFLLAALGSE